MNKGHKIKTLLSHYNKKSVKKTKKIKFFGIENKDVYNITAPFKIKRSTYILGRVEPREHEIGSRAMFFKRIKGQSSWHLVENFPIFDLQDPFISFLKDNFFIGGVETLQKSNKLGLSFRTVFYKGKKLDKINYFSKGPWGMKDIRFIQLDNNDIAVFTRPQGRKGRRGKIGFTILSSIKSLSPRVLTRAEIIQNQFARGEWGGVNEIHILKNNKLGILGHIAKFDKNKNRYYYPITFLFDYKTREFSGMKILATRNEIPKTESKKPDLYNVIFPGGLIRLKNKLAKLYCGVSDVEAYELTIEDPFLEYETEED